LSNDDEYCACHYHIPAHLKKTGRIIMHSNLHQKQC
jgi:hypothetical protein